LIEILGPDSQQIQLDPLDVLNADVRFKVQASQKMRTKQALQSGGLNTILTSYLNPSTMEQWKQQGLTPDMKTLDSLISDTMNLPAMTLVRQMTPQEMQMHQQQQMAPLMAKQQLQDSRLSAMAQMASDKDETGLLKAILMKFFPEEVVNQLFGSLFGMKHPEQIKAENAPKQLPGKSQ